MGDDRQKKDFDYRNDSLDNFIQMRIAMPSQDGYCRYFGNYVEVGREAPFPDGVVRKCIATDDWEPDV